MYDFADIRRNRAQDFAKVEARRDACRQIHEQLKPLVFAL
jgi:hypothetical protein